jgi:hypothetical protein
MQIVIYSSLSGISLSFASLIPRFSTGIRVDAFPGLPCDTEPAIFDRLYIEPSVNGSSLVSVRSGKAVRIIPTRVGCRALPSTEPVQWNIHDNHSNLSLYNVLIFTPFARYFNLFHLIFDDLFAIWFAMKRNLNASACVIVTRRVSEIELEALQLLSSKLIMTLSDLSRSSISGVTIGVDSRYDTLSRVTVVGSPSGINRRAVHRFNPQLTKFSEDILRYLLDMSPKYDVIWLARGPTGRRQITNELEVASAVAAWSQQRGLRFLFANNAGMSFSDQVSQMKEARIILGCHGAALSLLIFSKAGPQPSNGILRLR